MSIADTVTSGGLLVAPAGVLAVLAAGYGIAVTCPPPAQPVNGPVPRIAPRRRWLGHHRRARAADSTFPDLLDLIVIALYAGATPFGALDEASRWCTPHHRAALEEVRRRRVRGEPAATALDALVEHLGTRALTVVAVLLATERDGLPLAPAIEQLADDARQHRRRTAERATRELPVRLSFPLVLCILPSFVLVTIIPLLIGALSALRTA